jgi:hypothetical protein
MTSNGLNKKNYNNLEKKFFKMKKKRRSSILSHLNTKE